MRWGFLVLASVAACAPRTGAVYSYRQGPAQVTRMTPERPRYVYVPGDAGAVRLPAARIEVRFEEGRSARAEGELPLPGPEVSARATARLSALATGQGEVLHLEGRVEWLAARREGSSLHYESRVLYRLRDGREALLFENLTSAQVSVLDPPYDAAELEELRAGVLLESVDRFLANESLLTLIALRLASPRP